MRTIFTRDIATAIVSLGLLTSACTKSSDASYAEPASDASYATMPASAADTAASGATGADSSAENPQFPQNRSVPSTEQGTKIESSRGTFGGDEITVSPADSASASSGNPGGMAGTRGVTGGKNSNSNSGSVE